MTALHAQRPHGPRTVHRRVDARRPARPPSTLPALPRGRRGAAADGHRIRVSPPLSDLPTTTEDIAIAHGQRPLWKIFCPLRDLEHLRDDPRYSTNAERKRNRPSLIATLQDAFLTRTYEEWEAVLDAAGIPVGTINALEKVVEHPQALSRGVFAQCEHPVAGSVSVVLPYFRLSGTPGGVRAAAGRRSGSTPGRCCRASWGCRRGGRGAPAGRRDRAESLTPGLARARTPFSFRRTP